MSTARTTLYAGEDYVAAFTDGRPSEYARIQAVPLSRMPELLRAADDDATLLTLVTARPIEWVDALHPDTVAKLLEAAERLNFPPLAAWLARKAARLSRLTGEMTASATPTASGPSGATPSPASP